MLKIRLRKVLSLLGLIICGQGMFAQEHAVCFFTASQCRTVTFVDYSDSGGNIIDSRKIDFGDGTSSLAGKWNEHTYASDGNYTVKYYISRQFYPYPSAIHTDSITKVVNVSCTGNYGMKTWLWDTINCDLHGEVFRVFPQSGNGLKIKLEYGDGSADSNINEHYLHSYSQNKKYFVTATVSVYDPVSQTTYKDTFSKWIHYNCANTAIDEVNHRSKVRLYPNPTAGVLNIETDEEAALDFDITDVRGVQLFEGHLSAGEKFELDVSEWNKGLYIFSNSKGEHLKFVVE